MSFWGFFHPQRPHKMDMVETDVKGNVLRYRNQSQRLTTAEVQLDDRRVDIRVHSILT